MPKNFGIIFYDLYLKSCCVCAVGHFCFFQLLCQGEWWHQGFFFFSIFHAKNFRKALSAKYFEMEGPRGRARYRSPSNYGPRAMSVSRSRSRARSAAAAVRFRRTRSLASRRTAAVLGVEKKFFDTAVATVALTANTDMTAGEFDPTALPAAVACLSAPAQGDGEQNRDGKRIIVKSCQVKGAVSIAASELEAQTASPCKVFVALVQDMQTNGAQLNSEDVFKNLAAVAGTIVTPTRNLLFSSRFRVLRSEVLDMTIPTLSHFAADSFSFNGIQKEFEWFVPMDMPVNFGSGTTAVIANVVDNSLHLIAFATTTSKAPAIQYNARIRFIG